MTTMDPDQIVLVELARIGVKLDQLLAHSSDHENRLRAVEQRVEPPVQQIEQRLDDQEARLRGLERWRWLMTGIAAASGGAAGAAITSFLGA